jgi:YgiT-type zinc finger domain-containing protein
MSSSRRSSLSKRRPATGDCPVCGSPRVRAVVDDVVLHIGKRSHRFIAIPHERCEQCGERIFGINASKLFDAAILKGRARRAA